jgi:hypothetical protein
MQANLKLRRESKSPSVDATEYKSLVGSLRYLVHTRPDLAFAVGYVSRFMEDPHEEHLPSVKHATEYTRMKENQTVLLGFSDSDLADVDSRKSNSRIMFFLGDSPISWQSTKQKVVAFSSCEAEYIAAATAAY